MNLGKQVLLCPAEEASAGQLVLYEEAVVVIVVDVV